MTPLRHAAPPALDPEGLAAFRALLARPETRTDDVDAAALAHLEALGLVRRHDDGSLAVQSPHRPLTAEANRAQARADALREAAESLHAEFRRRPGAGRESLDVVVGAAEIVEAAVGIARTARHTVRGFDRGPYFHADPLPESAQSRSSARGVEWRVIYEGDSLRGEPPERWELIGSTPGETGRVMPHLPFKLLIADDAVALVGLVGPSPGSGEGLVVRGALLVDALVRLFEQQWELALPVSSGDHGALDPHDRRLLAMLSTGMTDEGMARSLEVSRRTVQRRVSELARRMGAEGRFQLGVQAARRGWV
ncbi:LuxR C-terminal-related transcriptional regulator [Micrococcaceae bacterium Sec6.3]